MSKSHAIKLSGWAFMLASFGFLAVNNDSTAVSFAGLVFNSIPLLVGMLGLRAGYGDRVGSFDRNILLVGVLGMVLAFVSGSVLNRIQPQIQIGYARFETSMLLYAGPAIGLLGLALFGLAPYIGNQWQG